MPEESPQQLLHRGQRAVQRLLEHAPASGGLALWMHHRDSDDDTAAPIANDGHTVVYGSAFARWPLTRQTGAVAHQVLHVALRHVARWQAWQRLRGDVDHELFNLCADAIVNSALAHQAWLDLPPDAPRLQTLLAAVFHRRCSDEEALAEWDVERLYDAVDDRPEGGGGRQGRQRPDGPRAAALRQLGRGQPRDLLPGAGEAPEGEAEAARAWTDRLQRAHAGDGPLSLLRLLLADLPQVRTPWEQVLRRQVANALSRRPGPSWSRPSRSWLANQGRAGPHRRRPWEPGTAADTHVPRVVLVIDSSGSIDAPLLARFRRELQALLRRLEARLTVVVGDDAVRAVLQFEAGRGAVPDLPDSPALGGGGTNFTPLLAEAERHRPDLTIVLTDLDGPADHRPRGPVLWAVTAAHAEAVCPFGRKLVLR